MLDSPVGFITIGGTGMAIVNTIEEGRGLTLEFEDREIEVKYLILYTNIAKLGDEVKEFGGGRVSKKIIPILISKGLLLSPPGREDI